MAQIGELFFTLGVQGGEKTLQTFGSMQKSVDGLASSSLATKAAIASVIYAFGSLLSASGQFGQNVSTMSTALGIGTKELQQFEQAGIKAGVSIEDMDSSIKSSFSKLNEYANISGQLPAKWDFLAQNAGIDKERWANPATHFEETIGALQRLYNSKNLEITPLLKASTAESFGISNYAMLQAIERGKLSPEIVGKQPFKSEGAIEQLNKVSAKLKEIKAEINNTFNDWSAKHGVQLLTDFKNIEVAFLHMVTALSDLMDKFKVFERIGQAMTLVGDLINRALGKEDKNSLLHKVDSYLQGKVNNIADSVNDTVSNVVTSASASVEKFSIPFYLLRDFYTNLSKYGDKNGSSDLDFFGGANPSILEFLKQNQAPNISPMDLNNGNSNQQVTVNQDINFNHSGTDFQRTASSMKDATVQAAQAWKFNPAHLRLT